MTLVAVSMLAPPLWSTPSQDTHPGQQAVEPGCTILYASPEGTPSGRGTRNDPLDLRSALSRVRPDVILELLGGIYRIPSKGLPRVSWLLEMGNDAAVERSRASGEKKSVIRAEKGARVIITKDTGYPPYVSLRAFTRLENIWFGGSKDPDQNGGVVTVSGDDELEGCVFFGYYGGIADGSPGHNLYQGNLFVNCGTDNLFHALYISGQPTDSARACIARQNIFVGGGGYHMHLWHKPHFTQLLGNFSGDASRALVLDGTGILARDNILWSNRRAPLLSHGDQSTTARFVHNIIGPHVTDYRRSSSSGFVADSNAFLTDVPQHPFGTHVSFWLESRLPEALGIDGAALDSAIVALERSFAADLPSVLADTSIARHRQILSNAIELWIRARPTGRDR